MNPHDTNLGYFNREAARLHADRMAIIDLFRAEPRHICHRILDDRMDRVGAVLQELGVKSGARLLLAMDNRAEFIEAFFGVMRAGVIPIPLNHRLGADTIRYIIEDSGAEAALVSPSCHSHIVEIVESAGLVPRIATEVPGPGWQDYETALAGCDTAALIPPRLASDATAFLPYTSGSTGVPKGVLLTHSGMLWQIRIAQKYWAATCEDRALIAGPLFHKNAMRVSVKPKLAVGGSVVIMPRFEPRMFLRALADYECTHTGGVPAMYRMILAEEDLLKTLRFPRLRNLEMGSAVVGAELITAVEEAFRVPVNEAYGLTEGGGPIREPSDDRPTPRGSCGLVSPEVEVRLVAADNRNTFGEGELWVRSPAVLAAYHNRPDLNRERLIDGYLRTGDIFRQDKDGFFYFMGRTDDQFSCGGENINPKEVELLLVQHPDVIDAVVVPVDHVVKGLAPAALVTLRSGRAPSEADLKDFTLRHGPAYAHPRRVFAVDSLPLNGAGKTDRAQARAMIMTRIGDDGRVGGF